MKYYFKLISAFIRRFGTIIFIGILIGVIVFLLLSYLIPRFFLTKPERIGYTGRYSTKDLPLEISSQIGKGLVTVTQTSVVQPALAKNWVIEEDGKKWIFELDDNLKWQDNKPINLEEINYNFSDVEVTKENNKITFNLREPYIPFVVLLENPIFKKGLLGTGEWKVKKLSIRGDYIQRLDLTKNNQKQIIKFYPTEDQTKLAFKLGEVDEIKNLLSPLPFNEWDNVNIEGNVKTDKVVVIFFNTQDKVLTEKNMRLALNYSVDKNNYPNRAISPINSMSIYFNPQVKSYDFDSEKAKELISELKDKIPEDYELKLISTPNLLDIADKISNNWNDLGISSSVLVSSVIPSDYQAFITIFDIPKDPDQYSLWHSTQEATNITKYKNVRIDKLLEDGRVEQNLDKRKKIYLDFQRYLAEDSPAIFLYNPVWYNVARK